MSWVGRPHHAEWSNVFSPLILKRLGERKKNIKVGSLTPIKW